jgi:hypothetical protein
MADAPVSLAEEEYRALRATIRERGTARPIVMTLTVVSWAGVNVWLQSAGAAPLLSLAALVILDAGFEAVFSMHVGVERIGRYLQTRYESANGPRWEHAAMTPPPPASGKPADSLFSTVFLLAACLNLVLACWAVVAVSPIAQAVTSSGATLDTPGVADISWTPFPMISIGMLVAAHALFVARVFSARTFAAGQRERELQFFSGQDPQKD